LILAELMQQRASQPKKISSQGDDWQNIFLQRLLSVALLSIRKKVEDGEAVFDFLRQSRVQSEVLMTARATSYIRVGRLAEAEMLLRQVLTECPDYEPALACLAYVCVSLQKGDSLPLAEKALVTSLDAPVRELAQMMVEKSTTEGAN
jgi:hypothetical protein